MTDTGAAIEHGASFCAVARPILWSVRDSDETILQVKQHNAAGAVLCGWGAPEHLQTPPPSNKKRPAGSFEPAGL
jgi:hypothetical protein